MCYICANCNINFNVSNIQKNKILNKTRKKPKFCSYNCFREYRIKFNNATVNCANCNKEIKKIVGELKKSKSGNHFCSKSCSVTYNNKHKTKGYRRSKLEQYLEIELIKLYPNLRILFNDKITINSELDIYIPELKLAFELNGIFHYEPIFGQEKLNQIQNNDNRKFQACIEQSIELCIIDTSKTKYLKKKIANNYLNIVTTIINQKSN
jgi:hypothetical protein